MRIPPIAFASLPSAASWAGELVVVNSPAGSGFYTAISDGSAWLATMPVWRGVWASRPAANASMPAYATIFVTDIGPHGTTFYSNGTYWMPSNGKALLKDTTTSPTVGLVGTTETIIDSFTIPSGLWFPGAKLHVNVGFEKAGTTTIDLTGKIRIGAAGTTSDSTVFTYTLATTAISIGRMDMLERVSTTTNRKLGSGAAGSATAFSSTSNTARASANNNANFDTTSNVVSFAMQWSTAPAGSELGTLNLFQVFLIG